MSDLWAGAMEAASDARHLADVRRFSSACNRAYYAMFNVARVLLVECEDIAAGKIKTHATVVRLFSLRFIRSGRFDAKFGEILRQAGDLRALVDYEGEAMSADDTLELIRAMDEFLAIALSVRSRGNQS